MSETSEIVIRPIESKDDPRVAEVIRSSLSEFGCTGPGFAIHDPEVDAMTAAYADSPDRQFLVVEVDGEVRGCAGYAPLEGSDPDQRIAELRKMYFRPELRGRGIGRRLLEELLVRMRDAGFRRCYLETFSGMDAAQALYRKLGFAEIGETRGATGHHACDRYFEREL